MILYFSATGNSKYVAERIASETGDTALPMQAVRGPVSVEAGGSLGIVTPTYSWEVPVVVRDFLKNTALRVADDAYVFVVSTYGTSPGASGADAKHILKGKGIRVDALYSVRMLDTWTVLFDLSDKEKVAETNRRAEQEIREITLHVKERRSGNHQKRRMPYAIRMLSDIVYQRMRKTSHFHVEDRCIGCRLCEESAL